MADLDLNIGGDARRAQAALNDVATGSARAARVADHLARSFDHLENEANDAQRAIDRVNDEISDSGPTAELTAELERLQRQLSEISHERFEADRLRAGFRNSTAAAARLDHELGDVRRELQRLNAEYSRSGDPAVLRQVQEQQRELARLNATRRRIATEDEENQRRLGRIADEARRAQGRRDDEERRRQDDADNSSFLRRLRRRASNLGDSAGNGLQGAPAPPAALAVGGAIGAAAAVPLLAAIGGALTGAVAAGVAGAGIAGAIMGDPEKFKAEWADAAGTLKTEFLDATAIFTGPTLDAIRGIGPLVEGWHLDDVFADAAKYVKPLVGGAESFATGIIRGVSAMVAKGEPAVEALSSGLAELGSAAGDAFETIADGAEGGGEALRDVLFATAALIRGFGQITEAAEDTYGYIHDHPIAAALMSGGLSIPLSYLDRFSDKTIQAGQALESVGHTGATAFYGLDQAERDALETTNRLNQAFDDTRDKILGLSNANIAVANDLRDVTTAFKENGATIDINKQKGADNLQVINQTVADLMRQRDAAIAAGGGTRDAYNQANAAFNAQLQNLEDMLVKLGLSRSAAHALMAEFYDKTITVTVKVRQVGNVSNEGVISSGDQRTQTGKAYAGGGEVSATGFSLVGEQGPELRFMNRGEYVATAAQTKALMAGAGGGGGASPTISLTAAAPAGGILQALVAWFVTGVRSGEIALQDSTGRPVKVA